MSDVTHSTLFFVWTTAGYLRPYLLEYCSDSEPDTAVRLSVVCLPTARSLSCITQFLSELGFIMVGELHTVTLSRVKVVRIG